MSDVPLSDQPQVLVIEMGDPSPEPGVLLKPGPCGAQDGAAVRHPRPPVGAECIAVPAER